MMPTGNRLGLVPDSVFHVEQRRWEQRERLRRRLSERPVNPDRKTREEVLRVAGVEINAPTTWAGLFRRQDVDAERTAAALPELAELAPEERRIIVGLLRYDGYLARHRRELERLRRLRHLEIPPDLDPRSIPGISREVADQLELHRPRTIADAERLPGVTAAAVAILAGRLGRRDGEGSWRES
jgi:tRNA uridine 5-carboxymethylaminomethyl modification enzyme